MKVFRVRHLLRRQPKPTLLFEYDALIIIVQRCFGNARNSRRDLLAQIGVSFAGIFAMTVVAYYISWSKQQDKPRPKPSSNAAMLSELSAAGEAAAAGRC